MTQEGPLDVVVAQWERIGSRLFIFRQTGMPQFHLGERKAGNESASVLQLLSATTIKPKVFISNKIRLLLLCCLMYSILFLPLHFLYTLLRMLTERKPPQRAGYVFLSNTAHNANCAWLSKLLSGTSPPVTLWASCWYRWFLWWWFFTEMGLGLPVWVKALDLTLASSQPVCHECIQPCWV